MNEFAGHKWFIVEREWVRKRERAHFKAFLLFPKWGWKSAAWLSPNKWLLLPFHSTQRPNPRTTWATNVDSDWDHHSMCQTLLTTHKTHWLQLYEVKMAQKGKMWRRCPQSFLPKKGHSIWAFNAKIKPKDRAEWIGSLLLFQSPSGTALFCFSTTDPCNLLCRSVTEKCGGKKKFQRWQRTSFEEFFLFCLHFFFSLPSGKYCTLSVNKGRMKKGL